MQSSRNMPHYTAAEGAGAAALAPKRSARLRARSRSSGSSFREEPCENRSDRFSFLRSSCSVVGAARMVGKARSKKSSRPTSLRIAHESLGCFLRRDAKLFRSLREALRSEGSGSRCCWSRGGRSSCSRRRDAELLRPTLPALLLCQSNRGGRERDAKLGGSGR